MNNSKSESNPNFLIVVIILLLIIVVCSGKFEENGNKEIKLTSTLQTSMDENNKTIITGEAMQVSDEDFNNLTMLVLAEAGGQPQDGKVAVAATVLNRYKERNYASIYDVIFDPGQFSCCYNGYFCHAAGIPLSFSDYPQYMINAAMNAVEEALQGKDPTREALGGGCLYYYNPDYTPDDELALRANLQTTFRIGDHVFYREWT